MCGILAYYSDQPLTSKEIDNCLMSLKSIKHRGPDGEGAVLFNTLTGESKILITEDTPDLILENTSSKGSNGDEKFNLFLGHRRLSVIDLSVHGHQPMKFKNNCIVFNGEVYNYLEIRHELKSKGYSFISETDTEVILKAYDCWGLNCVSRFNGMWSFVLWDELKQILFVCNDRFGVKPLYYANSNSKVIYASEIRQFHFFSCLDFSVNSENQDLYVNYGITPLDNTTYYNEIERFPKSTYKVIKLNANLTDEHVVYYSLNNLPKRSKLDFDDTVHELSYLLKDAIKLRMRSDVEIGISVSGGIDSTIILQFYKNIQSDLKNLKTFSSVSPDMEGDESEFIDFLIKQFEVNSYKSNSQNEFNTTDFENFLNHLEFPPKTMSFYAQWLIAKLMKEKDVTINLVGQGADEVFGGYHTHYYRYLRFLLLKGKIYKYFSELNAYSELRGVDKNVLHRIVVKDLAVLMAYKSGLRKIDDKLMNDNFKTSDITQFLKNDLLIYELPYFLHSDDRSSMAHSIETRHPFLDYRVVDFGYQIPENFYFRDGWSKHILRQLLPDSLGLIKWRKDKKGYTVPNDYFMKITTDHSTNTNLSFRRKCMDIIYNNC